MFGTTRRTAANPTMGGSHRLAGIDEMGRWRPVPARTCLAAAQLTASARADHLFGRRTDQKGLFIRTLGITCARPNTTLADRPH
jgi:hypothetical protein